MKKIILFLLCQFSLLPTFSQEPEEENQQAFEMLAETLGEATENDESQLRLHSLRITPVDVNRVELEELLSMGLDPVRANSFVLYREVFGPLQSKYELQAIPLWDPETIRALLPYLRFGLSVGDERDMKAVLSAGSHHFISRVGAVVEKTRGLTRDSSGARKYPGSPQKLFLRYNYQFRQQAWYGITVEKDAGERIWVKGKSRADFTSFHLFLRPGRTIKTLAVGDYVVNIGQGLIQWQGLAFGKSGQVLASFRQGKTLQPYRSAGEFNFFRGLAMEAQYKKLEWTVFGSARKLDANLETDSADGKYFTSISEAGLHRTGNETEDRGNLLLRSTGTVLQFRGKNWHLGGSWVHHCFSLPFQPRQQLYNRYAIRGEKWVNAGLHYDFSLRNLFGFGEIAWSRGGWAAVAGLLVNLHPKLDMIFHYRHMQSGYKSLYGRAFAEQSTAGNELGTYWGFQLQPAPAWQISAYADQFRFPWLRFRADAPGRGEEYLLQVHWVKKRKWTVYGRYRYGEKPENQMAGIMNQLQPVRTIQYRFHAERLLGRNWRLLSRLDHVKVYKDGAGEKGLSVFLEQLAPLPWASISLATRVQYFNTDGYDTRVFAYERDMLFSFSIPSFYDRGWRYYIRMQGKIPLAGKKEKFRLQWWFRWARTVYADRESIGSGLDEIMGNVKSDWKCQLMLSW